MPDKLKYLHLKIVCVFCAMMFCAAGIGQTNTENYLRYLDSADYHVSESPKVSTLFLDSIPQPVSSSIKGHLAEYYQLRTLIDDKFDNQADLYQGYLTTLKYAEQEKNHDIAGMACLELFYNIYMIKKDSSAFDYLDRAEHFYTLANNINGLTEVTQMAAYVEMSNKKYSRSNRLILDHLQDYKNIKDDAYYYMYALFMLTSNYIHMDDLPEAHKYFKELQSLKSNPTISPSLFDSHQATIFTCFAEVHLKHKAIDSTLYYLSKAKGVRKGMDDFDIRHYYNLNMDVNGYLGNLEEKNIYLDSLKLHQNEQLKKIVNASFDINHALMQTEAELKAESQKKQRNRIMVIILSVVLMVLIVLFLRSYQSLKFKIRVFIQKISKYNYIKDNHEKLQSRLVGLEGYISGLKQELKTISSIQDIEEQRKQIRKLYKELHLKSSLSLTNGKSHLELINELNADFFNRISVSYPQLNESEIVICYYLFNGFKNKDIAQFLNASIRAVESKRYRIGKKIGLHKENIPLVEYLQSEFKDTTKP
ncbi:MAG: hypothetical protein R2783_01395 [Gelidibacter sp.]